MISFVGLGLGREIKNGSFNHINVNLLVYYQDACFFERIEVKIRILFLDACYL